MVERNALTRDGMISVIVPVYNVASYLDRCVESIIKQTYENLEIILVNDGSTDGCAQICDAWAEKDHRVVVIHRNNGGLSCARNSGLSIAAGEFIMFVDSDDYIAPDLCRMLIGQMADSDTDCCICGYSEVAEDNSLLEHVYVNEQITMTGSDAIREVYLKNNRMINLVMVWGKLFRRQLWQSLQFTPGIYYEDLDLLPDLYLNCRKVICIPYIGYYYLQRVGSISHGVGVDDKRYTDSVQIRKSHVRKYHAVGEMEMAEVSMRYLVDLIITSDCSGWIPKAAAEQSKTLIRTYIPILVKKSPMREKIRFLVYRFFGRSVYSFFRKNSLGGNE